VPFFCAALLSFSDKAAAWSHSIEPLPPGAQSGAELFAGGLKMDSISYLIVPLLQGFEWFDEGLQRSLQARGWPQLTRPESMVMIHVILDITRPADIARSLGLTRQAVHTTISQIVAKGIFDLKDDPSDRRIKVVALTAEGRAMRRDAQAAVKYLADRLTERIGERHVQNLRDAFAQDWGPVTLCPLESAERLNVRRRLRVQSDTPTGESARSSRRAARRDGGSPGARSRRPAKPI
jgi:DNA-binding MarR family transcriptional regulator